MLPALEALWEWFDHPLSAGLLLLLLPLVSRRVRDFLRLLWRGGSRSYSLAKHWLRGGGGKIAYWCRELWRKMRDMRRQRLKCRVIRKLREYEACGALPQDQVAFLVQGIESLD